MNEVILNNVVYKAESYWRCSMHDKSRDMRGKQFPFPAANNIWTGSDQFIDKLTSIQDMLDQKAMNRSRNGLSEKCKNCLLCNEKNVTTKKYILNGFIWENGLAHYINKHGIRPSDDFMDFIYQYQINQHKLPLRLLGKTKSVDDLKYVKIDRNQLMILDALMIHGGYSKRYSDKDKNIFRYSEHSGVLDFENYNIERIIVSGNTTRIDRGDEEIYLPNDFEGMGEYEYIFHTHPPTPKPGGRVDGGILYEFPSMGDILHFIDNFNDGNIIGSLIMTSEGLYNIRKKNFDHDKIVIDEDAFYKEIKKKFREVQRENIRKYKSKFTTYEFYSKIAQDTSAISQINTNLDKYGLVIEFYPRIRDKNGMWIVESVYLPVF